MRWLLAGCCGLALIHLSVSLQVSQKPRFYGVSTNRAYLVIYCKSSREDQPATVEWYKAATYQAEKSELPLNDDRTYGLITKNKTKNAYLTIKNVHIGHSGVYFCRVNLTWGPGTHVAVVRFVNRENALYRSTMKDGLIVLQGLVLAACVAAIFLRRRTLVEKQDSIYEEPEADHIYEGLAIETCGGGLYEELSVYAQTEEAEAPWE